MKPKIKKTCLAYSGGLDTSIIIPWLKENYGCEVVAVAVDVGQAEETSGLEAKARKTGASEFYLVDAKEEFAKDYLFPVLKAGAVYEHDYLLGTSTARPLIAKKQVEIALKTGCDALSHGCTGKGNDQVRFELALHGARARLRDRRTVARVGHPAPARRDRLRGGTRHSRARQRRRIPTRATATSGTFARGRSLEEPASSLRGIHVQAHDGPRKAPDEPERVVISFEAGLPVAVNGTRLAPVALVEALNVLGGRHGVGRVDLVENRLIGIKSRGVYETPGGTLLVQALRALETLTLDRDSVHEKEKLAARYAELVYFGQWFSPLREALDAFMNALMPTVTGDVALKLFKGSSHVVGRTSPFALSRRARVLRHARYTPATAAVHPPSACLTKGRSPLGRAPTRPSSQERADWTQAALGWTVLRAAPRRPSRSTTLSFDRALPAEDVKGLDRGPQALGGAGPRRPRSRRLVTALEEIGAEAAKSGVPLPTRKTRTSTPSSSASRGEGRRPPGQAAHGVAQRPGPRRICVSHPRRARRGGRRARLALALAKRAERKPRRPCPATPT